MAIISNETELQGVLALVNAGEWNEDESIEFRGYPRFEVTLRGERFDGGVPTRIMPGLLELQRVVDKTAASVLGVKRLDKETLRRTEIVVRVEDGSSSFIADLAPALNTLAGQMSGTQALVAILGVALTTGGVIAFKSYLNYRLDLHRLDRRLELSQEETRRLAVVAELGNKYESFAEAMMRSEKMVATLVKKLEPEDTLSIGGTEIIDGETGRTLARNPRQGAIESRQDGEFIILEVASGKVPDGFRVTVRNTDTKEEMSVDIPGGTLTPEQIEQLKQGEWGKQPLRMQINVSRRGERIVKATLVQADLAP